MGMRGLLGLGAVCAVLAGCASAGTSPAAPTASVEAATPLDPMAVPACPRWDAEPMYAGGDPPDGAVSLRVCPGEKTVQEPYWKLAIAAPHDALVTAVDDLVTLLDELPDWGEPPAGSYCTQEGRPKVHYVFGYADGSTHSVTYGYGACHLLELEAPGKFPTSGTRAKKDAFLFAAAVADAFLDQRAGASRPDRVRPAPRCVPNIRPFTILPSPRLELQVAALCVLDAEGRWQRAVVPRPLTERLTAEYAVATPPQKECVFPPLAKVVGWSTWDDPVEIWLGEQCTVVAGLGRDEPLHWEISRDLADDLLALALGPPVEQR